MRKQVLSVAESVSYPLTVLLQVTDVLAANPKSRGRCCHHSQNARRELLRPRPHHGLCGSRRTAVRDIAIEVRAYTEDSASIVEQPLKIPFVAAIVLLANVHKPELTVDVLAKIGEALQNRLDQGVWREVKLYIRFLSCLQGMFEGEGVFPILDELFSRAADLQMKSSEDVCPL